MPFNIKYNRKLIKKVIRAMSKIFVIALIIMGYAYVAGSSDVSPQTLPVTAEIDPEKTELPVIMYHSLLKDQKSRGKYVVSPDEFESDLKYLRDHGYTTILISDLIEYTKGGDLPEKPILLTFDDGYYNNYYYAFPLLKKYESKAVISVIGYYTDLYSENEEKSAYYSHVTWDKIKEMYDSGLVEIGNHTYNLHSQKSGRMGVARIEGESDDTYGTRIAEDITKMQDLLLKKTGIEAQVFTYPFGIMSSYSKGVIRDLGFLCSLSCEEKKSVITREADSLFELGRYLRPSGISSEDFFFKIGIK